MHVNEVPECAILPVRRKVYFAFNGELNPLVNKFCSSVDSDIVIQARNGESELSCIFARGGVFRPIYRTPLPSVRTPTAHGVSRNRL